MNFFERHQQLLERTLQATASREYWSAYPESPNDRSYGEKAAESGKVEFDAMLCSRFDTGQSAHAGQVGSEYSPYGFALNVAYPKVDLDALLVSTAEASSDWRQAGPKAWVGVALEVLHRLNKQSALMAHAVMHTTGQPFMMAFQAGGPHAQERGLEAVAYAWQEMARVPQTAIWEKPQGKRPPIRLEKSYSIVPRGIGLVIGCSTFPTWNGYPGLFASLATGNTVVVKPHPAAILPLAITVKTARDVLREAGYSPDVVMLAAHDEGDELPKDLALRPEVRLIDFTGSRENGDWLEQNAVQANVYTEKAGVNQIIIDSSDDLEEMAANIAISLTLYSGQMCTAPQNIYIPHGGIAVGDGHASLNDVVRAISKSIATLTSDTGRAVELTGAIQSRQTVSRIDACRALGCDIVLDSIALNHPAYPEATIRTPLLLKAPLGGEGVAMKEFFGPVSFVVPTASTQRSIEVAGQTASQHGAMTLSLYTNDMTVVSQARDMAEVAGVALSVNMVGAALVNQSAAFSDFHGSGANPAANVALVDSAFVAGRFRIIQTRINKQPSKRV